jgi:flagellar FliL protein
MAKPAKPAAAPKKEDAPAEAAPKSNKLLIIIIAALVLVIVGGGAAWFLLGKSEHADAPKVEVHKDPHFVPLEAFTVNLQREEADQFLQATFSLKIMDPEIEVKIKAVLPEIRSKVNLLLSGKKPSELVSAEGKRKLALELRAIINNVLGFHNAADAHATTATPAADAEHADEHGATEHAAADGEAAHEPAVEGAGAPATEGAHEPAEPAAEGAHASTEIQGVVSVEFTSFIIQ